MGVAESFAEKRRVTLVGLALNLPLAIGKIALGIVGNSQALVADGIHSLSDLIGDGAILLAVRAGSRGADENHPYGHARFETLATVGVGLLLITVAVGMAYGAAMRIASDSPVPPPSVATLAAAAVSIVVKEWLYRYTMAAGRRLRSDLLKANAWHHRSDALSSGVALAGIAGAIAGLPLLDALAAILIATMLIKIGWDCIWPSLQELVDTGLSGARLQAIRDVVLSVPEVRKIGTLRTRRMGAEAYADLEVLVDPMLSVSDAHRISEAVRERVTSEVRELADISIHVEPDESTPQGRLDTLPPRSAALPTLREVWADLPGAAEIGSVTLHYIDGAINIDIVMPIRHRPVETPAAEDLADRYRRRAASRLPLGKLRLHWSES